MNFNSNAISILFEFQWCLFSILNNVSALKLAAERNDLDIVRLLFTVINIEIGKDCFKDCSQMKELTIPNSITTIGPSAFYGCSSLSKVSMPSSIVSIGSNAFHLCSLLSKIALPSSLSEIEKYVFSDWFRWQIYQL